MSVLSTDQQDVSLDHIYQSILGHDDRKVDVSELFKAVQRAQLRNAEKWEIIKALTAMRAEKVKIFNGIDRGTNQRLTMNTKIRDMTAKIRQHN